MHSILTGNHDPVRDSDAIVFVCTNSQCDLSSAPLYLGWHIKMMSYSMTVRNLIGQCGSLLFQNCKINIYSYCSYYCNLAWVSISI